MLRRLALGLTQALTTSANRFEFHSDFWVLVMSCNSGRAAKGLNTTTGGGSEQQSLGFRFKSHWGHKLLQVVLLLHHASLCFDSSLWLSLFIDYTSYRVAGSQPQLRVCNTHIFILIWRTAFTTVWECFLCLQTANLDTDMLNKDSNDGVQRGYRWSLWICGLSLLRVQPAE